jgi:DNA-directed RNA polymerase subunit RPC12/RpoP
MNKLFGKNNPNYKNGLYSDRPNKCLNCGKVLKRKNALRCKSCAKKGKLSPRYIDGKFIQKIFNCLECGNPVTHMALEGLCKPCAKKHLYKNGRNYPNCIDCGKKLTNYDTKRCRTCFGLSIRGSNHPMFGKSANWKRIQYKRIWMRSSWEVAYAKYLDKQGIKWFYESKTFDLGDTTYTPDFYLPEIDMYIEIKGWMRNKSKDKINIFLKGHKNFILLGKEELKNLKII